MSEKKIGKREQSRRDIEAVNATSRQLSADKRTLIAQLAREGLSSTEIAMIADVTETQAKNWAAKARQLAESSQASVSVQRRYNSSSLAQRLATHAENVSVKILKRMDDLVSTTDDISRLASALRVLTQIADNNKITTTMTSTVSRLREKIEK